MKEIEARRSIRKYKNDKIPSGIIEKLILSARDAPSGNNKQPWHFIVVTDDGIKAKIVKAANNQRWMLEAPVFIACVADIRARAELDRDAYIDEESAQFELKRVIRDTALATGNILLAATNYGLGTCWVGWYAQKEMRPILGVPEDKFIIGIITLGYPDEQPEKRPRKNLNEILHYEKW